MALSHRFIWGVNAAGVKGCVHFHDDSTVVYSVGHTVVLYNSSEKQQRFIAGSSEAQGFSAIALCPSKRFIAVAEKADRASIVVYDLRTLRKRKNLSQPDASCSRYANICFSQDNETLVAITGDGATPSLVTWRWAKGKVSATAALQEGAPGSVYFECLFSPLDSIITACSTSGLYFARASPEELRFMPSTQVDLGEGSELTCHCWLKQAENYCLAGTATGDLVLYQSCKYSCHLSTALEDRGVTALAAITQGFVGRRGHADDVDRRRGDEEGHRAAVRLAAEARVKVRVEDPEREDGDAAGRQRREAHAQARAAPLERRDAEAALRQALGARGRPRPHGAERDDGPEHDGQRDDEEPARRPEGPQTGRRVAVVEVVLVDGLVGPHGVDEGRRARVRAAVGAARVEHVVVRPRPHVVEGPLLLARLAAVLAGHGAHVAALGEERERERQAKDLHCGQSEREFSRVQRTR